MPAPAPAPKRRNQVHVYLSDEEVGMLTHVAEKHGLTHADVIRQALRGAYQIVLGAEVAKRGPIRAALQPRLDKRRENQAKPRGNAEAVAEKIWDATIGRKVGTTAAAVRENAKPRGGKP